MTDRRVTAAIHVADQYRQPMIRRWNLPFHVFQGPRVISLNTDAKFRGAISIVDKNGRNGSILNQTSAPGHRGNTEQPLLRLLNFAIRDFSVLSSRRSSVSASISDRRRYEIHPEALVRTGKLCPRYA